MTTIKAGKVVAVCLSPRKGIPKFPQERITVGPWGILGDYHAQPHHLHPQVDQGRPNLRQVSICAQEVYDDLAKHWGIKVPPGGFAENILVKGLGDLSDLLPGQQLVFSSGVVLEVTAQNRPCRNLCVYHPLLPKLIYGRRGVVALVKNTGLIEPGDTVTVEDVDGSRIIKVEAYAGAYYPEHPRRIFWRDRWWEVIQVLKQWQQPEGRYFIVALEGDIKVLICYYQGIDTWQFIRGWEEPIERRPSNV